MILSYYLVILVRPEGGFYLCSIKEATELQKFIWKIVVVDDLNPDVIKKLKISCKFKLWLAKNNLLVCRLHYNIS